MTTANDVYVGLKELGLTRAQARQLLPDWWTPEMEETPDGVAELCVLYSRRLHLNLSELVGGRIARDSDLGRIAFKHIAGKDPSSLRAATGVARALSHAVLSVTARADGGYPSQVEKWVELFAGGGRSISLQTLVDTCWRKGIPVIPMPNLPPGMKKMDGAVLNIAGRYAIVISKKRSSRAWLAFILAHEIGHIAHGHLEHEGSVVDVSLKEQATYAAESSSDSQERQADDFALQLFGGAAAAKEIGSWSVTTAPINLALLARNAGARLAVEPGALLLQFAFLRKRWPEAMTALNYLSEDSRAEDVLMRGLENVDFEQLGADSAEFVRRLTGLV